MDSTSGSMQSSSGGDEEYDSRAESISAFLNNPPSHVGPMSNPPQPQPPPPPPPPHHHHTHSSTSMFDPLSNYFDPLSRSPQLTTPNSLLNLDMMWSKTIRSEPNCNDLGGFIASSTSSQAFLNNQAQSRGTFPTMHISPVPENATRGSVLASTSNDQSNNNNVGRNSKKRSRASRRAPTTVLTTDTTNFRAMVQEFTGIPAPPFTSSPFPRSRLDLFGTASSLRSAAGHLDPSPPPYLLRPFAQKVQPPPYVSLTTTSVSSSLPSSSMVDAITSSTTTNNITSGSVSNTSNSTSIDYQLSSDLGFLKQPSNLLNMSMKNQILNFQSLLQAPPKYALPNSSILGSKPHASLEIPSHDSHLKMGGVLEEFGLGHGHVSTHLCGLPNIVSSDTTLSRNDNNPPNWGSGVGSNDGDQGLLRSLGGNCSNSQQVTNGKVNYSASSSDFHGDKGPENVTTRSEGMVESWICSTD